MGRFGRNADASENVLFAAESIRLRSTTVTTDTGHRSCVGGAGRLGGRVVRTFLPSGAGSRRRSKPGRTALELPGDTSPRGHAAGVLSEDGRSLSRSPGTGFGSTSRPAESVARQLPLAGRLGGLAKHGGARRFPTQVLPRSRPKNAKTLHLRCSKGMPTILAVPEFSGV